MLKNNNLKKSFIWNTLGTGLNSFNSLFFLIITTRLNGIKDAGIFTLCFATSCMFYCIAIYSGRTYQVTEVDSDVTDNEYIVNRIITSILMIIISIIFGLINGYYNNKLTILIILSIFKASEAICDVFHGILQKKDRLDIVGKSLFLRSLLNIIIFLVINFITRNLIISSISLIIVNLIVLLLVDIRCSIKYKEKNSKINLSAVFKIFTFGFYTFGFMFIANYLVNIPRYAIDSLNNESFQTIFGIIVMPATIILLINQFIMQPLIIKLKEYYLFKEKKLFLNLIFKLIFIVIIIGIACVLVGYFLGIPVLNLLYGLKLDNYLSNLLLIILGAILYTISNIFSNAMIIFRKTKIQFFIYLVVSFISYFISLYLVKTFGFDGGTYGYLISMVLLLTFYIFSFVITIKKVFICNNEKKS